MSRIDHCAGCRAARTKGKHWFYVYPEISSPAQAMEPIVKWCPICVPPDLVEKRRALKATIEDLALQHKDWSWVRIINTARRMAGLPGLQPWERQ